MEIGPELQATVITLLNAGASFVLWKLKTYKAESSRAKKRADAITYAVDAALADDGKINSAEVKRIIRVADQLA